MAFSTNPSLVQHRMGLLLELRAGRAARWETSADPEDTRRLASQIREALFAAAHHPERFPELARAAAAYSIHVIRPGLIEAKPKRGTVEAKTSAASTFSGAAWGKEVSTVGKTLASEVIESWQAHLPSNDALNFQQTTLPDSELRTLHAWASARAPKLMLLVGAGHLTLALAEPDMEGFAWRPAQAPPKKERDYDI